MKKEQRLEAEKFLLQQIYDENPDFVDATMQAFSVSRSTVYNYINTLQDNGELERVGGSMPYRVLYKTSRFTIDTTREHSRIGCSAVIFHLCLPTCRSTCKRSGVMPLPL